jgi:hypothetical protein
MQAERASLVHPNAERVLETLRHAQVAWNLLKCFMLDFVWYHVPQDSSISREFAKHVTQTVSDVQVRRPHAHLVPVLVISIREDV